MRNFYTATEKHNSSSEELTIEKINILIEHKNDIIKYLISKLYDWQEEQKKDDKPSLTFSNPGSAAQCSVRWSSSKILQTFRLLSGKFPRKCLFL